MLRGRELGDPQYTAAGAAGEMSSDDEGGAQDNVERPERRQRREGEVPTGSRICAAA